MLASTAKTELENLGFDVCYAEGGKSLQATKDRIKVTLPVSAGGDVDDDFLASMIGYAKRNATERAN